MRYGTYRLLAALAALFFAGCHPAETGAGRMADEGAAMREVAVKPVVYVLAVGKARPADPPKHQQRAIDAVRRIAAATRQFQSTAVVDALAENVMTPEQFRRGEPEVMVDKAAVTGRLRQLALTATAHDTVIVYTHTHGVRSGLDAPGRKGGLVLEPGRGQPGGGVLAWDEYAELILAIPARHVVVLTMACFSGGLAEHVNSPPVRERWRGRRDEGRSLVVLTSQNSALLSPPIVKNGELINPFTYAVAKALAGEADGFALVGGEPQQRPKDGTLTVGELIDFILYTTEHTASDFPRRENIAKPQLTGSFDRDATLLVKGASILCDVLEQRGRE